MYVSIPFTLNYLADYTCGAAKEVILLINTKAPFYLNKKVN
jgi:hypothetical protein